MSSSEDTRQTLLQWASANQLQDAVLSDDGATLTRQGVTLSAATTITVEFGGKSGTYSVASIFLQILDPNQGLLAYRNACKKYGCDPVKALDKPTIVGYFLGASTATAADGSAPAPVTAPAAVPETAAAAAAESQADVEMAKADADQEATAGVAAAAAETTTQEEEVAKGDRREKSSSKHHGDRKHRDRDRERHKDKEKKHEHRSSRKDKDRSDKKHKSRSGRDEAGASSSSQHRKKKKAKIVTNEQLFTNLSMVVDKRHLEQKAQEEITLALSAEGFQVTPEMLEEHRETTQMILANEIPVGNSASILRATNPKKNLSRVLELYLETINPGKGSHKGKHRSGGSGGPTVSSKPVRTYLVGKKPVIVVPKGMTSPITLLNAHEFLCNGKFVPRDVMLKQLGGQRGAMSSSSASTTFTRKVRSASGNHSGLLEFEIMDNPRKLGNNPKEWERIVAVIVLGQAWQFKDWPPPYNNPVQLFSQTLGYYISMEGDKIPAEISGWAVKQAKLNRDKRGMDSVTYAGFWNALEEFMAVHRAELLPQQEA